MKLYDEPQVVEDMDKAEAGEPGPLRRLASALRQCKQDLQDLKEATLAKLARRYL